MALEVHSSSVSSGLRHAADAESTTGCYALLLRSFHEGQKRCENLSNDLVRQAQANASLVQTLDKTKDANKHLHEQVRKQSEEITQLMQQRVSDEERIDGAMRKRHREDEISRQETQRRIDLIEEGWQEKYNRLRHKFDLMLPRLAAFKSQVARLREEQQEQMSCWKGQVSEFQTQFDMVERTFVQQFRRYERQKAELRCKVHELDVQLTSEKKSRENDVSTWSTRHSSLATEKEDVRASMASTMTELTSELQTSMRTLDHERSLREQSSNEIATLNTVFNTQLAQQQGCIDALHYELGCIRCLLSEKQAKLNCTKAEREREAQQAAADKLRLQEEMQQLTEKLEGALQKQVLLTSERDQRDKDHVRMAEEIRGLKHAKSVQESAASKSQARCERLKRDYETHNRCLEERCTSLTKELDELKACMIGQHRQKLRAEIDDHMQLIEQHHGRLRDQLQRSEGPSPSPIAVGETDPWQSMSSSTLQDMSVSKSPLRNP